MFQFNTCSIELIILAIYFQYISIIHLANSETAWERKLYWEYDIYSTVQPTEHASLIDPTSRLTTATYGENRGPIAEPATKTTPRAAKVNFWCQVDDNEATDNPLSIERTDNRRTLVIAQAATISAQFLA